MPISQCVLVIVVTGHSEGILRDLVNKFLGITAARVLSSSILVNPLELLEPLSISGLSTAGQGRVVPG